MHNKYHGRDLNVEGVKNELQFFFSNGVRLRGDAVQLTLNKLKKLKTLLETQTTFSFYSCSLLLMYDGSLSLTKDSDSTCSMQEERQPGDEMSDSDLSYPDRVDVRLIDFAHVTNRVNKDTIDHSDDGIIFGLENLIAILSALLKT